MRWNHLVVVLLLIIGCVETPPKVSEVKTHASGVVELTPGVFGEKAVCREFDWLTRRGSATVICRMLWCSDENGSGATGGPATLWCDLSDGGTVRD